MSPEDKKLEKLLGDLNNNIELLSRITALTFRKETLFKGTETKQQQIEVLEELKLPDDFIALIIGSTVESVRSLRSMRKAKSKKVAEQPKPVEPQPAEPTEEQVTK